MPDLIPRHDAGQGVADDEEVVSGFTAHPPTARKVERSGYAAHKVSTRGGQPVGWLTRCPGRVPLAGGRPEEARHERGSAPGPDRSVAQSPPAGRVMTWPEARVARDSL